MKTKNLVSFVLCKDVTKDMFPIEVTITFKENDPIVVAIAKIENWYESVTWTMKWIQENKDFFVSVTETIPNNTKAVKYLYSVFNLAAANSAGHDVKGVWNVELNINGNILNNLSFRVLESNKDDGFKVKQGRFLDSYC